RTTPRARTGDDRAAHAAQRARPRTIQSPGTTTAGYVESIRTLVGRSRAIRAVLLRTRKRRRAVRTDWVRHVLRAGGSSSRQAARHPRVLGSFATPRCAASREAPIG